MSTVSQILDSIAEEVARADRSDGQLLDLFVRLRDPHAFAELVRRHGSMVLGVCRRVLRNAADADDAFQAAFLVLARKADTISGRHLLAQWLYGVAYNTARKLRRSNTRRAVRERPLPGSAEPLANTPEPRDELLAILDEELNQLPDRYRSVILLCDLEGLTRREVAKLLDCPEGTVGGRLSRARDLLAERLRKRGIVSAAGVLATVFAERIATAVPPAALAVVVRAVAVDDLASAAAQGLISARVAHTTEGVLKSMFATKLRTIAAALLCCGLALACGAGAIHLANAQPQPDPQPKNSFDPFAPSKGTKSAPEKAKPADADPKQLCVIPLKKLEAKPTAEKLLTLLPKEVTVAAVRDENAILVYATAKGTDDVKLVLRTLGEELPKNEPEPTKRKMKTYTSATFAYRDTPWAEVLAWYSAESGLTFVSSVKPTGTFTFWPAEGRLFTFADITDGINESLAHTKLILVRREKTFILHPADEKLDPAAWRRVELTALPTLGKTELVEVQISLTGWDAVEARDELRKLLTPFGEIPFAKGKTLVLRDTVGNIARILNAVETVDKPVRPVFVDPIDPRKPPMAPKMYTVRFDKKPWKDVFAWYAQETGLTYVGDTRPTGTFTFGTKPLPDALEVLSPVYTLAEITDHINDALLAQKWLLIRREKTFVVVPADEKLDPTLVPRIPFKELGSYGRTELVQVVLAPKGLRVEDSVPVAKKLLGPFGSITELPNDSLVIQDVAGNIVKINKAIEDLAAEKK